MCLSLVLEPEDQGRPFTHTVEGHALPRFMGRQTDSICSQAEKFLLLLLVFSHQQKHYGSMKTIGKISLR